MTYKDKQSIADSFSLAAKTYDGHVPAQKYVATALFGHIAHFLPPSCNRIADAGCGTGFLSEMLRLCLPEAHLCCVDLAPGMILECRNKVGEKNTRYVVGDLEHNDFGEGYDLIASSYALQWTNLARALENLNHCLAHSGMLALALPVVGSFPELAEAYKLASGRELPGPDYASENEVKKILQSLEMECIFWHVEDFTVYFPTARDVLRSFKRCGAAFHRYHDYEPLRVEQIKKMLDLYDVPMREKKNRVGLTFRTLYCLARKTPAKNY
jgi:malonyl-CoA O-methyltransferase